MIGLSLLTRPASASVLSLFAVLLFYVLMEHATYVIDNSNDLTSLINQVNALHETLTHD